MTAPISDAGLTRSRTTNPYERALWAFASALLLGSIAATVWAQDVFLSHNSGWSGNAPPADFQMAQVLSSFAPSALTAGILLAGVALAIRAVMHDRRTVAVHPVAAPDPVPTHDSDAAPTYPVAFESKRDRSAPVDHSLYMRPQNGG